MLGASHKHLLRPRRAELHTELVQDVNNGPIPEDLGHCLHVRVCVNAWEWRGRSDKSRVFPRGSRFPVGSALAIKQSHLAEAPPQNLPLPSEAGDFKVHLELCLAVVSRRVLWRIWFTVYAAWAGDQGSQGSQPRWLSSSSRSWTFAFTALSCELFVLQRFSLQLHSNRLKSCTLSVQCEPSASGLHCLISLTVMRLSPSCFPHLWDNWMMSEGKVRQSFYVLARLSY